MQQGTEPGRGDVTRAVKQLAREAGFDLVRVTEATVMHVERARYLSWIEQGRQGEMSWITPERARRSSDPSSMLPQARSVVSLALSYWGGRRPPASPNTGSVARYAWGIDYHTVLGDRLGKLSESLGTRFGGRHRWYVDTGPAMDKALAARAGIGWYGKNTNILTETYGSFVLLGEIITTLELEPDTPLSRNCGACRLCLTACPTGALGPEHEIDSRKCISYLTIEHRGAIPLELRPLMGGWVFGCDICQDVCPPTMRPHLSGRGEVRAWASEVRALTGRTPLPEEPPSDVEAEPAHSLESATGPLLPQGRRTKLDLIWLLHLTQEEYATTFRGTALKRAKVWMLRRNAAIALGNTGTAEAFQALAMCLSTDEHPLVRGHAAWALSRLCSRLKIAGSEEPLRRALRREWDSDVRREIQWALDQTLAPSPT